MQTHRFCTLFPTLNCKQIILLSTYHSFFFFIDPATPEIYTLSLHDALPIYAHTITSLLSGMSISFGDDDVRHEVIERFLWKMGRGEQRRQILYALEFLRALHAVAGSPPERSEEHTSELQSHSDLVCRLLLEK